MYYLHLQGKKLPYSLGADAEEGEVSDEDSADEIEDDYKLNFSYVSPYTTSSRRVSKKIEAFFLVCQTGHGCGQFGCGLGVCQP